MSPPRDARPLAGARIVTTRDTPGRLDELLGQLGATVVHVPLIRIEEPDDGGDGLRRALDRLDTAGWLVVTSQHGADRVGGAAAGSTVKLAAVGTRTAAVLAARSGRHVDLVPERQTAADLVAAFPPPTRPAERVVAALGDLAAPTLAEGLRAIGYDVEVVVAYRTVARRPSTAERAAALGADAVVFASGSSATAWSAAFGPVAPAVVVIGPTTASAARAAGLQVTAVAADHSLDGLVATVVDLLR